MPWLGMLLSVWSVSPALGYKLGGKALIHRNYHPYSSRVQLKNHLRHLLTSEGLPIMYLTSLCFVLIYKKRVRLSMQLQ